MFKKSILNLIFVSSITLPALGLAANYCPSVSNVHHKTHNIWSAQGGWAGATKGTGSVSLKHFTSAVWSQNGHGSVSCFYLTSNNDYLMLHKDQRVTKPTGKSWKSRPNIMHLVSCRSKNPKHCPF